MLFGNKKTEMYMIYKHKIAYNRDNDETRVKADGITTKSSGYLT